MGMAVASLSFAMISRKRDEDPNLGNCRRLRPIAFSEIVRMNTVTSHQVGPRLGHSLPPLGKPLGNVAKKTKLFRIAVRMFPPGFTPMAKARGRVQRREWAQLESTTIRRRLGARSADWQSAVSPNGIRQAKGNGNASRIANPRYGRLPVCATVVLSSCAPGAKAPLNPSLRADEEGG